MPLLEWTPALELGEPTMDATHREYANLLNQMGEAADEDFLPRMDAFIAHTARHFADEDAQMAATRFPPSHCHNHEHEQVLLIMRDVRERVANGEVYLGRVLATEMGKWFEHHAGSMDKVLAYWLVLGEAGRAQLIASSAQAPNSCSPAGCDMHEHDHQHEQHQAVTAAAPSSVA
ncbi:MAG: hemerythrin domain-containing protein [Burkholderiales bacterium]